MRQQTDESRGHRRRRGRTVVRLDTAALWERLTILNRSQNWLAREIGISPSYVSMLVNEGRTPSGRVRTTDAQGPRPDRLSPTFQIGGTR